MGVVMRVIFWLLGMILLFGGSSLAQSPVQEVGDEKEPELRAELVRLVIQDQNIRGEYDKYRKAHGLFSIDDKTLNEKLNNDPEMKKELLAIIRRMQESDEHGVLRMKEIIAKYGWPGKSLVGTEAAGSAWMLVQHADRDVAFQRLALEAMTKLPSCDVENTHLAYLTDRVLLNEGKKQLYGTMLRKENGKFVPKPIEDEANVEKRRAELGLQPLAEYIRRQSKALLPKQAKSQ
jgi:hypothetical protein